MAKKIAFEVVIPIPQSLLDNFYDMIDLHMWELMSVITPTELKTNAQVKAYITKLIINDLKEYAAEDLDPSMFEEANIEKIFKKEIAAAKTKKGSKA
jgi:hypothetical protein